MEHCVFQKNRGIAYSQIVQASCSVSVLFATRIACGVFTCYRLLFKTLSLDGEFAGRSPLGKEVRLSPNLSLPSATDHQHHSESQLPP